MARSFNGTSDSLQSAATLADLASSPRLSVGFWLYGTYVPDDNIVLELGLNGINSINGSFGLIANDSGILLPSLVLKGSTHTHYASLAASPSNNEWHHHLFNFDFGLPGGNLQITSWYVDGVLQTLTATDGAAFSNVGQNFANEILYVMARGDDSLFTDGRLADLCLWQSDTAGGLTSEAATLAAGARANTVRTSEIAYYWPLLGTTSPEPATIGGVALEVTGASFVSDPPALSTPVASALAVSVTRVDDTTVSIDWDDADSSITNGVSIVRGAGDLSDSLDSAGKAAGESGYDPTTISGVSVVSENVTTSPYSDTVPSAGVYTYWINRSA